MFWIAYRDEVMEEHPILKTLTEESADYLLKHKVRILSYKLKIAVKELKDAEKRSWRAFRSMTNMLRPGISALIQKKEDYFK